MRIRKEKCTTKAEVLKVMRTELLSWNSETFLGFQRCWLREIDIFSKLLKTHLNTDINWRYINGEDDSSLVR